MFWSTKTEINSKSEGKYCDSCGGESEHSGLGGITICIVMVCIVWVWGITMHIVMVCIVLVREQ